MSLFRERFLWCVIITYFYTTTKSGKTIHHLAFGTSTAYTALETDKSNGRSSSLQYNNSKYANLWKPHLLTALPHTGNWQDWQVKFKRVTLKASGTYLASAEKALVIGRCINERGKTLLKSLPEDLTTNTKGDDPQVYWQMSVSSTQGGRRGIFLTLEQTYGVQHAWGTCFDTAESWCFYN